MVCRWTGQTITCITESRGGHGLLPLAVPEQASPVAPITSEEVIAIKHKLLLFSLPWELMHLLLLLPNALVTLKICLELINHFPGPFN